MPALSTDHTTAALPRLCDHPRTLLQLLPPAHRLSADAANLADSAHLVAARHHHPLRITCPRPLWHAAPLTAQAHHQAVAIHAIGDAILACLGCRQPVIFTPSGGITLAQHLALAAVARLAPTLIVAPHILPVARIPRFLRPHLETHYIPPTLDLPPQRIGRNAELRRRLGFAPTDRVVLAAGSSDHHARHTLVLWAVAILAMIDPSWRLLLVGHGPNLDRLERFAQGACRPGLLTFARRIDPRLSFPDLLPAADLAIDVALRPVSARPIYEAIAAELPLLATANPLTSPLLPATALLPRDTTPKTLARRLLDLTSGSTLQHHVETISALARDLRKHPPLPHWSALLARLTP